MKRFMSSVLAILLLTSSLALADDTSAATPQPNVLSRAIAWTADSVISKPLAIVGNIVNMRFRILYHEKKSDGSRSFALLDFDTRSKEQRDSDNAESAYE